jgi:hypothetical protein
MPPQDTTPRGDEMVRRLPERKFPVPKRQGPREDSEMGGAPLSQDDAQPADSSSGAADISRRPALPDHPVHMDADVEDET